MAVKLIHNTDPNEQSVDSKQEKGKFKDAKLTKREIEILKFIANEASNGEIAKKLNIAKRTVDAHRQNLLHKIGVSNTAGLVKYAMEFKLI